MKAVFKTTGGGGGKDSLKDGVATCEAGDQIFTKRFKPGRDSEEITFTLDKALPPDKTDPRERGIIVASIDCE